MPGSFPVPPPSQVKGPRNEVGIERSGEHVLSCSLCILKLAFKDKTVVIASGSKFNSGALAARKAAKRSPILIWERKGNPSMNFLMVIMASGIARGRVRTITTESRKMAAII